jgi:hypothetical protein
MNIAAVQQDFPAFLLSGSDQSAHTLLGCRRDERAAVSIH